MFDVVMIRLRTHLTAMEMRTKMSSNLCKTVGTAVREARKSMGLTQDELAQRSGLSRRAVILLETNGGRMSSLNQVARVLALRMTGLPSAPSLGEQLLRARDRKKLSQADVAAAAGVSLPTIRALEKGGGSVAALTAVLVALVPETRRRRPARPTWNEAGDVRLTPPEWIDAVQAAFGPISLDPCWHPQTFFRPERTIDEHQDGLAMPWKGRLAFVNPPFSELSSWINRCANAVQNREVESIVALLPVRFETAAFQDRIAGTADLLLVRNKPRFFNADRERLSIATFAVYFACWNCSADGLRVLATAVGGRIVWAGGFE
jgi:transcriptional regulator with XRE-family HTH domain